MKNPKKILTFISVLLAAAIVLTFTACIDGPTDNTDTKTHASLSILEGSAYSFTVDIGGVGMDVHVDGDNIRVNIFGIPQLIVDGKVYEFNYEDMTATASPATQEDIDALRKQFSGFAKMVRLNEARLTSTGVAIFDSREHHYEEFTEADGTVKRAFFNEDNEMIGVYMALEGEDDKSEVGYHIRADVPDDAFEVPERFTVVTKLPPPSWGDGETT